MSQIAGQLSLTELEDSPPPEVNGAAARGDVGRTGHPRDECLLDAVGVPHQVLVAKRRKQRRIARKPE